MTAKLPELDSTGVVARADRARASVSVVLWPATLAWGLLLVATLLRLVGLDRFPPGLHFDEAVYGLQALDIVAGARPVFFSSYTGREPLYMYLLAVLFAGGGASAFVIRLTSAFIGILTVALTFALGRSLYGRRVGLVAMGLIAVSYWHLTVSRNGYPNILIPAIEAASAYWLWRGWRGGRHRDWVLGGGLAGLVLYTYLAARFWPVFLLLFLVFALVMDRATGRARWKGIVLAFAAAVLVFAPLGWHFYRHPADFWERANQVLALRQARGIELWLAYLENVRRTAMAFLLPGAGDPRWHYNLPGRAILQPLVAIFFVIGLGLCLRRFRDLRFALPVLWIAVLTLPGILTLELQPAGQRIFGIYPALVLVPALGLVAVGDWLARRLGRLRPTGLAVLAPGVPAALAALVLIADGLQTVVDYFADWSRQPETAHIFNADYVVMAREAREDWAAGRTVVLLSEHYRHPTVAFLAPELAAGAVWADPLSALPWPLPRGPDPGPAVFYRLSVSLPDEAPAAAELEARLSRSPGAGRRLIEVMPYAPDRLDGRHLSVLRYADLAAPGPETMGAGGVLNGELRWSASSGPPLDAARGFRLSVAVPWTVAATPAGARGMALHLRDSAGQTWAQADGLGFLADQWQVGDQVLQWFDLEVPRDMPPGDYAVWLVLTDGAGQALGGEGARVAEVQVAPGRGRSAAPDVALVQTFGDGLGVLAVGSAATEVVPGGITVVDITWMRLAGDPPDTWQLSLEDEDGRRWPLGTWPIAASYPPLDWDEREVLHGRYPVTLPADLVAGAYRVLVGVPGRDEALELGRTRVDIGERSFSPPPDTIPLGAALGNSVRLLGMGPLPTRVAAGQPLTVTLYWRAEATSREAPKVFLHVVDEAGKLLAQSDAQPAAGRRPLAGWLPGEVVADTHVVQVPADATPGPLQFRVGLYDAQTGTRWPVIAKGLVVIDNAVVLPSAIPVGP